MPASPDPIDRFFRLIDAAYERSSLAIGSNLPRSRMNIEGDGSINASENRNPYGQLVDKAGGATQLAIGHAARAHVDAARDVRRT